MNIYYTNNGIFKGEFFDINWGKLHREDGPAIKYEDGSKELYVNGYGDKIWYYNGNRHRENGPAFEMANGDCFWYCNDKLHRLDGPAVIFINGQKDYFINGIELSRYGYYNHPEVIEYLQLKNIPQYIKDLIYEYRGNESKDILEVIQDYFLEHNFISNLTYNDIVIEVVCNHNISNKTYDDIITEAICYQNILKK